MKTARRYVNEESGMALPLAVIMIVLLSVMGAGLLTFVSRDLNTVAEQNRGQRAFELADAGVGVAKRQLTDDCAGDINCIYNYDRSRNADGTITDEQQEDLQWSELNADGTTGGVTLNNLDGSDTTMDRVRVTIDYHFGRDEFQIVSTGTYGEHNRKIEAILKGIGGSFGGAGIGHPLYYTPSNITIEGDSAAEIKLSAISMFTQGDIILEGFNEELAEGVANRKCDLAAVTSAPFKTDYENNNCGVFQVDSVKDRLEDWDSKRFQDASRQGSWNTVGRRGEPGYTTTGCRTDTQECERPGFAAEGTICAVPADSAIGECRDPLSGNPIPSIADGVYGYDSTTGTKGNNFAFAEKINCSTGVPEPTRDPNGTTCTTPAYNIISYPFPMLEPKEARLKRIAQEQEAEAEGGYYYSGCDPPWDDIFDDSGRNSVIFIDAGSCVDPLKMDYNGNGFGIMVVWCGQLEHVSSTKYFGILMNSYGDGLNPDGSSFASNCEGDTSRGVYSIDNSQMFGWLYAEGGDENRSGITIGAGSTIHFYSGADWNFLDDAFSGTAPTGFSIRSWRECYELEPHGTCST